MSRHDDNKNWNSSGARSSAGNSDMCNGLLCLPMTPMQAIEGTLPVMVACMASTKVLQRVNRVQDAIH